MSRLVASLLASAAVASATAAQPAPMPADFARQAVESYTRALETPDRDARLAAFRRAKHLFAGVADAGARSAELYTNLGNAALLSEDLGGAVLAYRRALLLDPDHPRALQNLDHVRSLLPSWVPRPDPPGLLDSFFFWHQTLPPATRALVASLCFAAAALLVSASIRFGQGSLRTLALLPGLVWIGLSVSLAIDRFVPEDAAAVITASEVTARSADSALAPAALPEPLPGGTEVAIVGRRAPWLRVRLANGRDAWLPESGVTPVAWNDADLDAPEASSATPPPPRSGSSPRESG